MPGESYRDGGDMTCLAGASQASSRYLAVEVASTATDPVSVTVCNAATDMVYGIIQDGVASGRATRIRKSGITKWVSDGSGTAIARGDAVGTNNAGKCVKKAVAGDIVRGIALEPSSADGTIITVDLDVQRMIPA